MTLAEFDRLPDDERDLWIVDWQTRRFECSDCGRPIDECSDPERKFYPFRRICYATMEREAAAAALAALRDEAHFHDGTFTSWAKERSDSHPYPSGAGESIGVADADLAPWDEFTTKRDASPVPPSVDEQAPGEQDEPAE